MVAYAYTGKSKNEVISVHETILKWNIVNKIGIAKNVHSTIVR